MVDASADHVRTALQQRTSPSAAWCPQGFFSKKLEPAQVKYSAFDQELWACIAGIRHFRFRLEGRQLTILTDHKLLTFALSRTSEPWTARQSRHLSYIAKFRHIAGTENVVVDTLSCPATVGPAKADKGSTKVKVPSGSLVPPATAGTPKVASVARGVDKVLDYRCPPGFLPGNSEDPGILVSGHQGGGF